MTIIGRVLSLGALSILTLSLGRHNGSIIGLPAFSAAITFLLNSLNLRTLSKLIN